MIKTSKIDDDLRNLPVTTLTEAQLEKWSGKVQMPLLFNRACLFAARRLRDYQRSGLSVVSSVLATLALFFGSILCFGAINYALDQLDPTAFSLSQNASAFHFFYYSFHTFLFGTVPEVQAVEPASQFLAMVENFFAVFLSLIFVSMLIVARTQKYENELTATISGIEAEGRSVEEFVKSEYGVATLDDAIVATQNIKGNLAIIINFLSRDMN